MSGHAGPGDEDQSAGSRAEDDERLPAGARAGIAVLIVTAVLAGVAAIGGQALVDGADLSLRLPNASELREQLPAKNEPGTDTSPDSGSTDSGSTDSGPTNRASQARPADLDDARMLLDRQAAAVEDADRDAYLATIDPESAEYLDAAARAFDNLAAMPIRDYRFGDLTADGGGLSPDRVAELGQSAWVADVGVDVQFDASDNGWWSTALRLTFVRRDGELYVANDAEGLGRNEPRPIWLLDEVQAVVGEHGLVIGTGSAERLGAVADAVDTGVPEVSAVWHRNWSEHVVVIMPATQRQMERVIGAGPGSQTKVAAVTTSVGRHSAEGGSHIVINPTTFDAIGSRSQQIVLTHEAVHVASEATVSSVPVWLSEGLADYVGFKRSELGIATTAQGLLADVRRDGPPDDLPDSVAFDPRQPELDRAYEAAWLACVYIAETSGEDTLVEFYEAMSEVTTEADEAAVYRDVLGHTPDSFVAAWRDYLVEKAG